MSPFFALHCLWALNKHMTSKPGLLLPSRVCEVWEATTCATARSSGAVGPYQAETLPGTCVFDSIIRV